MPEEGELAARCLAGDHDAWESLARRYYRKVWHVAYRYTGRVEEADELTQEVFLRLLGALESFKPGSSLTAWILRIARNHCIDRYRRRRLELAVTRDSPDAADSAPEPTGVTDPHLALERKDIAAWIRTALRQLPDDLREAVFMRDLQEMSYQEIADVLDLPLGTVKSRINRGRLELARELRRDGFLPEGKGEAVP